MIETKCAECGKSIIRHHRKKKIHNYFCSVKCKNIFSHKNTFTVVCCEFCGKKFEKKISELKRIKSVFCSKECRSKSLTGEEFYDEVICSLCGKKFRKYKKRIKTKNDFCSQKCYFDFKSQRETDKLRIYYYEVGKETYRWEKSLIEESDMTCYYTGKKLISNEDFKKMFPEKHVNSNDLQPTIDHKISVIYGFNNNIAPSIIGGKNNLCVCARKVNRTKGILNEKDFVNQC